VDGKLAFQGNPYWHCWKLRTNDQAAIDAAQERANFWANRILQREIEHDGMYLNPTELAELYTPAHQDGEFNDIFDQRISAALLVLMPEYSSELSQRIADLGGINPTVYAALRAAMQHAALFRRVKASSPAELEGFVASLAGVSAQPAVALPLLFHPPQ
jgi:hypothetical protein